MPRPSMKAVMSSFMPPRSSGCGDIVLNYCTPASYGRRATSREHPFARSSQLACVTLSAYQKPYIMLFSKEYVGYLAREVSKKLVASGLIETKTVPALTEKIHASLLEELALEDRINDEVRVILEAYSEEMQKSGANYQEMFRKVKTELVKKYKAVL